MRLRYATALAVALVAGAVGAAPPDGPIRLPTQPVTPQPAPSPDAAVKLTPDLLYVFDSDVPVLVLTSPKGILNVTSEEGPLKIRGKFVDGTGKSETRTYKGKFVFTAEPVGTGRVELLVIPQGSVNPDQVIRRTLDVSSGQAPQPPPTPDPKPVDPAPIPVAGLRVLIVYESADLPKYTPAQNGIIYGAKTRDWLNANCVAGPDGKTREWRMWDKDIATDGEAKLWQDAMKRPRKSTPWLIVSNGVAGFEGPLPANADEFLALVEKYKGGSK